MGAPGVLSNDTDANNDPLTASLETGRRKGPSRYRPMVLLCIRRMLRFYAADRQLYLSSLRWKRPLFASSDGQYCDRSGRFQPSIGLVRFNKWRDPMRLATNLCCLRLHQTIIIRSARCAFSAGIRSITIYVDIGVVNNSPYEWNLDTTTLNFLWNQVFVSVRDGAGNNSSFQFIWVYRDLPFQLFMPRVAR